MRLDRPMSADETHRVDYWKGRCERYKGMPVLIETVDIEFPTCRGILTAVDLIGDHDPRVYLKCGAVHTHIPIRLIKRVTVNPVAASVN